MKITKRPRRLRQSPLIRNLVSETDLHLSQLIQPYFLHLEPKAKESIKGFTSVFRWGMDRLSSQIEADLERSLRNFLLFADTDKKDALGKSAYDDTGLIPRTLQVLRERFGKDIVLFTDVCLCPYTDHGHCGILKGEEILNDPSLDVLSKMALCHAQAGADFVAPSDMMDSRIQAIRDTLDEHDLSQVGILAYTAKYASSYYGPFREALDSSPKKMDRKSYQMDWRNRTDALRELRLDLEEGADIVMVKPALPYLDIISLFKEYSDVPVAAYSVSAEYEMVKRLAADGTADEPTMVRENLTAIRRAGAKIIVTYSATEAAEKGWLR